MVRAAARGDGVLLERAQARRRLARVEHGHASALDGVDVAPRERRDAGQPAEEVERDTLAGEDRTLRARRRGRRRQAPRLRRRPRRTPRTGSRDRARGRSASATTQPADDARLLHEQRRPSRRHPPGPLPRSSRRRRRCPRRAPRGRSARRCRSLQPCLERGPRARPEDDVSLERLALGREVRAEVRAAALLARERRLRDEPREQVRARRADSRARRRRG